jgi:hypothetical protein
MQHSVFVGQLTVKRSGLALPNVPLSRFVWPVGSATKDAVACSCAGLKQKLPDGYCCDLDGTVAVLPLCFLLFPHFS